jgi:CHASE3 domain sensor protein
LSSTANAGRELVLRSRLAIGAGFLLLAFAGVTAIFMAFASARGDRWSAHSLEVRHTEAELFSTVQDAEIGPRGYLLTGDLSYLAPFNDAERRLPAMTAELSRLIGDNPVQTQRLTVLATDIDRKMRELERTVHQAKGGDLAGSLALVKTNQGRDLMARIRAESAALDQTEQGLLAGRQQQARQQSLVLVAVIALALLLAAALAYAVATEAGRHARDIVGHNEALEQEKAEREKVETMLRQSQ